MMGRPLPYGCADGPGALPRDGRGPAGPDGMKLQKNYQIKTVMEKITEYLTRSTVHTSEVRAWEETVLLPTYGIGREEKNPIFLEKRVYQGSSGSVYPYPVVEKIEDEKHDRPYRAFFLENEYIKVMILPELGGRVHMAYDKVKQRHFVYYNQVVKPALVGLTGPWISGGIEFNWPQHHRPSTFLPTDCSIEEFPDGSKTVWCSEVERMFRTKGMAGFTLYPGKAYIEIKGKVYNRTPFPQTFLWWANPAVVVNKDYYSVFPPDVNAVFDHGKRDVSTFPIATGTYYKMDYSSGVDISRYSNIPVPTSYMAVNSRYDFVGGYDESAGAGLLHVADHHVSVGKKQWTWGHGDFGRAWDRNLTDEDGPYIELMTGVYTDNQPDFTWLQPYEEKSWVQYFMPYQQVGRVKNATRDAVVNLEPAAAGSYRVTVYTTAAHGEVRVCLKNVATGQVCLDVMTPVSPAQPYATCVKTGEADGFDLELSVYDSTGRLLVAYRAERPELKPNAPRIETMTIPKEFIGAVIGPGGKIIQGMQEETGAIISIEEIDGVGRIEIAGTNKKCIDDAVRMIKSIVAIPEIGEVYTGKVRSIMPYGAFVEFLPGKDGLLHISEIDWKRLETIEESGLKEGDEIQVKLMDIDPKTGKFKLSHKVLVPKPEGMADEKPNHRPKHDHKPQGHKEK